MRLVPGFALCRLVDSIDHDVNAVHERRGWIAIGCDVASGLLCSPLGFESLIQEYANVV